MKRCNRPITSREYKLMLNVDRFSNRASGTETFWRLVKSLAQEQGGKIHDEQPDICHRQTRYMDTADRGLRQHGFVLRVRQSSNEPKTKITLKFRDEDRYLAAIQQVSSPDQDEAKFEEDILPPFRSKFARSSVVWVDGVPQWPDLGHLLAHFPGLHKLQIPKGTPLETVNGLTAHEVAVQRGKLQFGKQAGLHKEYLIKVCMTFWYPSDRDDEPPLVTEFSYDYDVLKSRLGKSRRLEQFPRQVVSAAHHLFQALQEETDWIDLGATTKTAFAYQYKSPVKDR
jgi:hypothetical protein